MTQGQMILLFAAWVVIVIMGMALVIFGKAIGKLNEEVGALKKETPMSLSGINGRMDGLNVRMGNFEYKHDRLKREVAMLRRPPIYKPGARVKDLLVKEVHLDDDAEYKYHVILTGVFDNEVSFVFSERQLRMWKGWKKTVGDRLRETGEDTIEAIRIAIENPWKVLQIKKD